MKVHMIQLQKSTRVSKGKVLHVNLVLDWRLLEVTVVVVNVVVAGDVVVVEDKVVGDDLDIVEVVVVIANRFFHL